MSTENPEKYLHDEMQELINTGLINDYKIDEQQDSISIKFNDTNMCAFYFQLPVFVVPKLIWEQVINHDSDPAEKRTTIAIMGLAPTHMCNGNTIKISEKELEAAVYQLESIDVDRDYTVTGNAVIYYRPDVSAMLGVLADNIDIILPLLEITPGVNQHLPVETVAEINAIVGKDIQSLMTLMHLSRRDIAQMALDYGRKGYISIQS